MFMMARHTPPRHRSATPHTTPQSPQFMSSEFTFTHIPSQSAASQVHSESTHSPKRQRISHIPQCSGCAAVSTQRPPHSVKGQMHVPPSQMRPPVHATPQAPQFSGSVSSTTQEPAQSVSPAAQLSLHVLMLQTSSMAQGSSQPPQWAGSIVMSTQTPLHEVLSTQSQEPATHSAPPVQRIPQPPQWCG